MNDPIQFYKSQIEKHQKQINKFKKRLLLLSLARIFVYLVGVMGIYIFFHDIEITLFVAVVSVGFFLFLVSKHTDVKMQRDLYAKLLKINEEEIAIASGDFKERDDGLQYQDSNHFYCLDIDLFGLGSFFQLINRTAIHEGTHKLVEILKANSIIDIKKRQTAIEELATKPVWRQEYMAKAQLIAVRTSANKIVKWLRDYNSFIPKLMKWVPLLFSGLSVTIIILAIGKVIPLVIIGYWLLVGLVLTAFYFKKVNNLAHYTGLIKDTIRQYALLLTQIEAEIFTSELLLQEQKKIQSNHKKASEILGSLSKSLDALENRNNIFSVILANGFFLWDIWQSYKIEKWIVKYNIKVKDWFEVVTFFDAFNSLGNYRFNYQHFVFPEIKESETLIDAKNLGHPLLDKNERIDSDLHIKKEQFFIVTGANMAGKSTFLRTVSLHIVMANIGLPVCAEASKYSPIKLVTSMRTNDSLVEHSSYFFSELTRLKFIVDAIEGEPYFIILDEILKGTNSTDKAIGSRKFVEKLVKSNATGIIATHDLSLCEIEQELEEVDNYFFDARIENDELVFDYKLKKGVCQNMNASFLLKKMEIV